MTVSSTGAVRGAGTWTQSGRGISREQMIQRLAIVTTVFAVLYNGLFAVLAVRGVPVNITVVIACEITIMLVALGTSALGGFRRSDALPLGYIYLSAMLAVVMTMIQGRIAVDGLRNILIIASFTLLGARASERTVRVVFATCALVTLIVLIWEIVSVDSYAAVFRPLDYLVKTRGYQVKEFYEDSGLSVGAAGYADRFSFGIFNGPRTSSVFLEQVGINCFAIVLMVYLSALWSRISNWERALAIVTLLLIILSNNARMASLLLPVMIAGYFVFPRLPRYSNIVIPAILLTIVATLFQFIPLRTGDDLIGRLGVTQKFLMRLDTDDLLFGELGMMSRAFDTGYGYIIVASTIFGALAYWAYLTFIVPHDSVVKRRAGWSMNTYIYLWLLVGGTASFSMKTASLLWFLIGFIRVLPADATPGKPVSRQPVFQRSDNGAVEPSIRSTWSGTNHPPIG